MNIRRIKWVLVLGLVSVAHANYDINQSTHKTKRFSVTGKEKGTGSHGGDPQSIEFALIGRQLHSDIAKYGGSIFEEDFSLSFFKEKIDTAEIDGYLFDEDSQGSDLRRKKFELHNSFEIKCAINKYQENIIELDRKCFSEIENYLTKKALVLHEYLGLMKKEWDLSYISSKLILLENEMATKDYLEERTRILEDYKLLFNAEQDFFKIKRLKVWACEEYSFANPKYRSEHNSYTFDDSFKLINRINDRYSGRIYHYDSKSGHAQSEFKIKGDTYIDRVRVNAKGEILSILSYIDEKETVEVLARKCTTFKSELKNRINLLSHRVKDYLSYRFDKERLTKAFNRILKRRSTRNCLERNVNLESDIHNYGDHKYMQSGSKESLFDNKNCFKTMISIRDTAKSFQNEEEEVLAKLERALKNNQLWPESIENVSDRATAKRIIDELVSEIVVAQNNLFETAMLTEEERGGCSHRLKVSYLVECALVSQYQDFAFLQPLVRLKQLEKFENSIDSILKSI